ncbi:TlpA disulfide reductase family protein [Candidatus Vondammii sp. HM_W22]|uniref:TlpA disulfide reductase family protein n=1 Tax=Candidatus Vondammii sp. HM_W22 TaxID=2687299 RepID=UPI001F13CF90|nr:TlpA disulfide reductase family protein [Candidatus Vondammii sp. HM_W22]
MRKFLTIKFALLLWLVIFPVSVMAEPIDFTLPDLDGKERSLSDFRGKWVLVNYWATWCPPCLAEMPELELFHNQHKEKDAMVIGVAMDDMDSKRLKVFLERQFISYPILQRSSGTHTELGTVPALPTSYLISPEGEIVARQVGTVTGEVIENYIKKHNKQQQIAGREVK